MVRDRAFRLLRRWFARGVVPRVLWVLRLVVPTRSQVVVCGRPATEGNAVETVRALQDRYTGGIYWFGAPDEEYQRAVGIDPERVRALDKNSPRAVLAYLAAECVFYTNGIYGHPRTVPHKLTINLWHACGPKKNVPSLFPDRVVGGVAADCIIGSSRLWGEQLAREAGLPPADLLLTGLPRNDDLFRPTSDESLRALGVDPGRPFVLWMPTFRRAVGDSVRGAWQDTSISADGDDGLAAGLADAARQLADQGIQLVVKAHPLDAAARRVPGAHVVDDEELRRAGVPLYRFVARADGMVSDVSSVWTDYLLLDRPIGFYFPDAAEYRTGRGFHPDDLLAWLPGPDLSDGKGWQAFGHDVRNGGGASRTRRQSVRDRVGYVCVGDAGPRLLDAVRVRARPGLAIRLQDPVSAHRAELGSER